MVDQEKKGKKQEKYESRVRALASQGENFVCRTVVLSWPCAGEAGSALPCCRCHALLGGHGMGHGHSPVWFPHS